MKLKSLKKSIAKIKNKAVFLRVDFNVPLANGQIKDDSKIAAALPTIRFLLRYRCRIILATHLGEPSGKVNRKFDVRPLATRLTKMLGANRLTVSKEIIGAKVTTAAKKLKPGKILFLQNLRFNGGEENNNLAFAKKLASLAEVYVNEAFAVSHRSHASVSAIKKFLPAYAGLFLEEEIRNLDKVKKPAKPLAVLLGGAKIKSKINLINNLATPAEKILIGGALANNFFQAMGLSIGKSLADKESVAVAKKLLKNKKILLPIDVVVETNHGPRVKIIDEIAAQDIISDIGPQTIWLFASILRKARTLIWNGPLGVFEQPHYRHGTVALGEVIAARSRGKAFGVVGGGETVEALKLTKMEHWVDWISTGGGAMLAYLGNEKMPGLD
ncbi:MAG TPA: phosphoglycerate kinase [Candidatus Methylomirabilis sp.]|nr:phosphoglycerate kinase [Candidatus Methylomirabilis sp.]